MMSISSKVVLCLQSRPTHTFFSFLYCLFSRVLHGKRYSQTSKKAFPLITASGTDKDLPAELLSHAYLNAKLVSIAFVHAFFRFATFLFLPSPLLQHIAASSLSSFLSLLTYSQLLCGKTFGIDTFFSTHTHVFLRSILLKLSALLSLGALLIRTQ